MCSIFTIDKERCVVSGLCYQLYGFERIGSKFLVIFLLLVCSFATSQNLDDTRRLSSCKTDKPTTYKMDESGDSAGVELVEDGFGFLETIDKDGVPCNRIVRRFTMTNRNGVSVQIITYGATVTSVQVPDKVGSIEDVVLGYDDMKGYLSDNNPYFGAVIGRVANRIRGAKFSIGEKEYNVSMNKEGFQLHGGFKGFDKVLWESHVEGTKLTLSYLSKDGEEGFPGTLLTHATYQLTPDNELILEMKATSTRPTPVNLCNHSYFNLAGHASGTKGILEHTVSINADKYTVYDELSIPTGEIKDVGGTYLDLRIPKLMDKVLRTVPGGGFDNNLCVSRGLQGEMNFVARVVHGPSGRVMEVHSDQPGVQFYTSNFLPDFNATREKQVIGKDATPYHKWGALCLETQNYPDAVNHKNFPDSVLTPGNEYSHKVIYRFSTATSE